MLSILLIVYGVLAVVVTYWIVWCIYAMYFHPAARFPGPKLAAVSELWYVWTLFGGQSPFIMQELHRRYGPAVRIAPNDISFDSVRSYRDIYAQKNKLTFLKSEMHYATANDASSMSFRRNLDEHAMLRRRMAPSFSVAAMRSQEHVIHRYVDLFVKMLGRTSDEKAGGVDLSDVFAWLTFDIFCELGFGESFNCVQEGRAGPWVSLMTDPSYLTLFPLIGLRKRFPAIMLLIPFMLPKGALGKMKRHRDLTAAKVRRRVEMDHLKDDFFAPVVEDIKTGKATYEYLEAESGFFAIAGAETTATSLAAAMWFLKANPECLTRLQKDIRTAFKSYDEITGDATANLPYLNAVIEETLRRYSPVPFGLVRDSPGALVDGHYIPRGTRVSTNSWVAQNNDKDWVEPESFKPERWLGDPTLQSGKEPPTILAFTLGSYQCLGITMAYLEMRIALAKILYSYDWEVLDGPKDYLAESKGYFLWHKPPYVVKFHPSATIS